MIIISNITTTISKGYIEELPKSGSNIYVVRMPLYEDNTGTKMLFNATACFPPGYNGGYSVGDVVFLTFENEKPEMAIILGKLFTVETEQKQTTTLENFSKNALIKKRVGDYAEITSTAKVNSLEISDSVDLPKNTSLGETITVDKLEEALRKIEYLENEINELKNK